MDFSVEAQQAVEASSGLTSAVGPFLILMVILALGMLGRMVYIAWGDDFDFSSLFSGGSMGKLVAFLIAAPIAGLYLTDSEVKAWVLVQQKVIDPVLVDVLKRDSCNPARDEFCVVVWEEDGREIFVNWHDKRVDAMKVFGGYEFSLYTSKRPQVRPQHIADAHAVIVTEDIQSDGT